MVRIDVWFDSRGLPLALDEAFTQSQATLPGLLHITVHERLSYSQIPLRVTPPSRSTVVVAPSLDAAIRLTNSYNPQLCTCFHSGCDG